MALLPGTFGYNFVFWMFVSLSRFVSEIAGRYHIKRRYPVALPAPRQRITPGNVAVILAAHNEELALPDTLAALKKNVPADNIYVGSDASTDRTAQIAREHGCHVYEVTPNQGKAKILDFLLNYYSILQRYQAVLIMDAEVVVQDDYLKRILPYFDDQRVAAFVSHAVSRWHHHWLPRPSMLFTAYRIRLWLTLYYGLRYGQTWKYFNVTPIIPGGSSVYRSLALKDIEIDTPNLIIEDFHMTFQVHHKKLGLIASHPTARIIDQEPYSLRDYYNQVHRWYLGFWQTFFLHGYWHSGFWYATALFTLEMLLFSWILLVLFSVLMLLAIFPDINFVMTRISITSLGIEQMPITAIGILSGIFVIDYVVTIMTAIIERKPAILLYGLGFFLLRLLDSFMFLQTLVEALMFGRRSSGTWRSPARRHLIASG